MKAIRLLIAIALLAMLAGTYSIALAQSTLPPICSGVQLQNKGAANADTVTLSFYAHGDNDGVPEYDYPVPGGIAVDVSKSFYIPGILPSTVPSGGYSVVVSTSEVLNSLVNQVDCDLTAPRVGSSHSGFEADDIGTPLYLGYVLSRAFAAGWSSALAIQNASDTSADANITVDFYRSGESVPVTTFTKTGLKYGETWYLDLSSGEFATPALNNFSGTAKVTSTEKVAAVANYAPLDGSRMLSFNGTARKSQKLFATQVMKHYTIDDYTGGFVLYNPNGTSTPISMKYYQTGQTTPVCTINDTIQANASYIKYLGSISSCNTGTLANGFNGYLVVDVTSGANQILGIFNFDSAAGQAGAANMMTLEEASPVLYFPQIVRNYSGYQSGWQVVNTTGTDLNLSVEYRQTSGALTYTQSVALPANSNVSIYVGSISQLGSNWNGGAKITVQGGVGGIVGQANFIGLGVVETLLIYNGSAP